MEKVRKVTNEFNQVFVCDVGSRQMINVVFILFASYFFVCFSSNSFTAKVPRSARYFHQCSGLMQTCKAELDQQRQDAKGTLVDGNRAAHG